MKKSVIIVLLLVTVMMVSVLTGCGQSASGAAAGAGMSAVATGAVPMTAQAPAEAILAATEEVVENVVMAAKEATKTPEEELEALKEHLVYTGGLCIHDPDSDLMMAMFKKDGEPIAVIQELGNTYYGDFTTVTGTLDDGREYSRMFIADVEYGYHFAESDSEDSFMVDQNGKEYFADDVYEEVAYDMVLDTLKAR